MRSIVSRRLGLLCQLEAELRKLAETKTVKVNHDTERVQVSPDGARLNLNKLSLQELLDDEAKSNGAS